MYTLILYMWDVQYTSKVWNQEDFYVFERSLLRSPMLHLFYLMLYFIYLTIILSNIITFKM